MSMSGISYDVPVQSQEENKFSKYDQLPTKSAKIRAMYDDGIKKTIIASYLGIRYQHVRNVLMTPLKSR